MAVATDAQVQRFVDERTRVRSEAIRALVAAFQDDIAAFDDVFLALTQPDPTWEDTSQSAPPHLLIPTDVLAVNSFVVDTLAAMQNHGQYPIVLKACVRPIL